MNTETKIRLSPEGECAFAGNVILLSHSELGFWQAVQTRLHLLKCKSCRAHSHSAIAVKKILFAMNSPGSTVPSSIVGNRKGLRKVQYAIVATVALASLAFGISYISGAFSVSDDGSSSTIGSNATEAGISQADCVEPMGPKQRKGALKKSGFFRSKSD